MNFDNINLSLNKSLHHSSNLFLLNLFNGNKTSSEHECSKYKITYSRTRLKMGIELISFSFLYIFFFFILPYYSEKIIISIIERNKFRQSISIQSQTSTIVQISLQRPIELLHRPKWGQKFTRKRRGEKIARKDKAFTSSTSKLSISGKLTRISNENAKSSRKGTEL